MVSLVLRRKWLAISIGFCAAMLAVVAGLQLAWTAQLNEAQSAMMHGALENSVRQFSREIGQECLMLNALVRPRGRGAGADPWGRMAAGYALWRETSAHPQLVRRMLVYAEGPAGGKMRLREWVEEGGQPVDAEWDSDLAEARDLLTADPRMAADPIWRVFPDSALAIHAVLALDRPERGGRREIRAENTGFLILVLDRNYLSDVLLPGLVRRLFSGPDGETLYDVAIAAREGRGFLYRSDPSIGAQWLDGADIRRDLRVFVEVPARWRDRARPGAPRLRRPQVPRLQRESPRAPPRPSLGRGGPATTSMPMLVHVEGGRVGLQVAASHVSGSLTAVVRRQRARNLATGLGVLVLLAGAMVLVILSARRAAGLARMQMEFVAGVSHEFRTPLSVICSVGENLADGVVRDEAQGRQYGRLLRDQGRRLAEMVEQILEFAAIEAGGRRFSLEDLDPRVAVRRAVDEARPMVERAGFELQYPDAPVDVPAVRADARALQQILSNLLSNAVKYGEPGRRAHVEVVGRPTTGTPEVQVRVADRGMGIPAREAHRVFGAFYRGSAARESGVKGSGLGLKVAHDLAAGMGGRLTFRNRKGQGTVFVVHLPLAERAGSGS